MRRDQPGRGPRRTAELRRKLRRLRKKYGPEILYTYSFPHEVPAQPGGNAGYRLIEADPASLAEVRAIYPRELSQRKHQLLRERLDENGQACWLISDQRGDVCGYCHVSFVPTLNARINHFVELAPTQAYFFDDYVFKKHRGKGLHSFSIRERLELVGNKGVTQGITTISRSNYASVASFGKFGLRRELMLIHLPALKKTLRVPRR